MQYDVYAKGEELNIFSAQMKKDFPDFKSAWLKRRRRDKSQEVTLWLHWIEPLAENRTAVGLDIASDETRREAAESDSGDARLTNEIRLVQSPEGPGYLLLVPFYTRKVGWRPSRTGGRILLGFSLCSYREGKRWQQHMLLSLI